MSSASRMARPPRRFAVHPVPRRVLFAAACVLAGGALWFRHWWLSPEHRMRQFVAAVNRGDFRSMIRLADDAEVSALGITPANLAAVLRDAGGQTAGVSLYIRESADLPPLQATVRRSLCVALATDRGAPVLDTYGRPTVTWVMAYRARGRWHIGLSRFLVGVVTGQTRDRPLARSRIRTIWARHGIPLKVFMPEEARWRDIPPR